MMNKLVLLIPSLVVLVIACGLGYTLTYWHDNQIDLRLLTTLKTKLFKPDFERLTKLLVRSMYNRRAGDPKFFYVVDQTRLDYAENLICNIMAKNSIKPSVGSANVYFVAVDKVSEIALEKIYDEESVVYAPFDEALKLAKEENVDILWIIKAILTKKIADRYGEVFAFGDVETVWYKELNSLGHHHKRKKATWSLVFNTIGYWGPLASRPLFSFYFVNPTEETRQFLDEYLNRLLRTGIRDRHIVADLCKEYYAGANCTTMASPQIIKPAFFTMTPKNRKGHLAVSLDLRPWHHYIPFGTEIMEDRVSNNNLWFLDEAKLAESSVGLQEDEIDERDKCVHNRVKNATTRNGIASLWSERVDWRLWYVYFVHNIGQYCIPLNLI